MAPVLLPSLLRKYWGCNVDFFDILAKSWPILLAIITLIIVLAKLDLRVAVLEEKVKQLFEMWNKK